MNGLIAWWARNTIAANLLMASILIAGTYAFINIEREVFPSAAFNGATVSVAWPGASPRDIEEQVILRIEEAMSGIDGVEHIDSTAREGSASVNVEGLDTIDPAQFLNEIKSKVDGISTLPQGAFRPVVTQWRNEEQAMFIALNADLGERELNRLARQLRDEVAQLPKGSPLVSLWGERREEVSIEVSEESLRRYALTFDDVANAVRGSSLNVAAGQVRTETGNIQVAARSLADSETEFESIIVRQQPDGSVIRISDVGRVVDGFEDRKERRELNGKPSISIAISAPETFNVVEMSRAVRDWVDKKNKELDGKAELVIWFDSSDIYYGNMNLVTGNAIGGLVLVMICLMLFLRPEVAFWVTIGIPIALAGAFIFMPLVGVSLNFLSLFGFLLVIGIVVDDAIVVGENIHNFTEKGEGGGGVNTAILATQLVSKPVFFAVLTTIIAFLPWLFISGGTSQFTKHITLTVVFALIFSLIESFFILPAHLSHLKKQNRDSLFFRLQRTFSDGLVNFSEQRVRPIAKFALRFRYFTVAFFLGLFGIAVGLLAQGWIAFKFQPEVQGTFISLNVRLAEGSPFARSLEIFDDVESAAARLKTKLGKVEDEDYVKSVFIRASEGSVVSYMTIVEADVRKESTEDVAEMFRAELGDIPDAEEINIGFTVNNSGPDLAFGVESDDLESLRLATVDIQTFLASLPGVYDVRNNLQSATPELQIELKPGAERFGLTLGEVTRQVRQAFYGEEVQRLPRAGQDVQVFVRYPASDRETLTTIDTMRVRTADGREVPLTSVADAKFAPSFKRIDRRDRQRSARITAELVEGVDRAAIMKSFREEFVPEWRARHPDAALAQRGDAEEQAEFMGQFLGLYLVAFVAMYMVIAIAFGSYWQPILVLSAIPFGFMGAAFGHFALGLDFALFSFFGVGAAAGVVINDNLVLIDYVNRLRAKGEGAFAALVRGSVDRFRPIILTSVTTFLGLLPIMFERSTDAQFLMPTVVALAWGVFFALFVTLFFVPAMYAVGTDVARFYRWAWTGEKQPAFGRGQSLESDFGTGESTSFPAVGARPLPSFVKPAE